jgi:hypothetical protein
MLDAAGGEIQSTLDLGTIVDDEKELAAMSRFKTATEFHEITSAMSVADDFELTMFCAAARLNFCAAKRDAALVRRGKRASVMS